MSGLTALAPEYGRAAYGHQPPPALNLAGDRLRRRIRTSPGAKHLPPFPQRKDLRLPDRLNFLFIWQPGERKFIPLRAIERAENHIPDRADRGKVSVAMFRQRT